jgi:hypothetical protein
MTRKQDTIESAIRRLKTLGEFNIRQVIHAGEAMEPNIVQADLERGSPLAIFAINVVDSRAARN